MKRDRPSLWAALTTGVLVNVLLRSQSAYWPRAGALAALVCAPLLAAAAWGFARAWRAGQCPLLRLLFAALLAYSAALELLHFWVLTQRLYTGLPLTVVCLMLLLPGVYLRRVSAISQTAHVVLCLLLLASGFMLLTVLPRLHVTNLQTFALQPADLLTAAQEQLTLYPEYLLSALWPQRGRQKRCPLLRLALAALWFDVGIHLVLELFYGAALPLRVDPVHAAARCGALSVFNRLESLQLALWVMALALKLALYFYAACLLLGQTRQQANAVPLRRYPLYLGGMWALCLLLRNADLDAALQARGAFVWGFAALTGMGGAAAWLCRKTKRCT